MVKEPTRIVENNASCIDHLLIRTTKNLNFNHNVDQLSITDHYNPFGDFSRDRPVICWPKSLITGLSLDADVTFIFI